MTDEERIQNGYAALVLIEDETVKAFFKNAEKAALERAVQTPHDATEALLEVRHLRHLRKSLEAAAQMARNHRDKK